MKTYATLPTSLRELIEEIVKDAVEARPFQVEFRPVEHNLSDHMKENIERIVIDTLDSRPKEHDLSDSMKENVERIVIDTVKAKLKLVATSILEDRLRGKDRSQIVKLEVERVMKNILGNRPKYPHPRIRLTNASCHLAALTLKEIASENPGVNALLKGEIPGLHTVTLVPRSRVPKGFPFEQRFLIIGIDYDAIPKTRPFGWRVVLK